MSVMMMMMMNIGLHRMGVIDDNKNWAAWDGCDDSDEYWVAGDECDGEYWVA